MIDKNRIIEPLPPKGPGVERRRHTRWPLDRPCKIRRASSITFEPATTCNVSPGGIRLLVTGEKRFATGDRVELAVAWQSQPVVRGDSVLVGRVVRVGPALRGQSVAIAFEQATSLDGAMLDPAA
ncbi:MAG TPA: PilZ domain-containing protein [Phycisphaerales bacterium]|nr:PilZ domain-containing protein [Phycisphaerales bacterium]